MVDSINRQRGLTQLLSIWKFKLMFFIRTSILIFTVRNADWDDGT